MSTLLIAFRNRSLTIYQSRMAYVVSFLMLILQRAPMLPQLTTWSLWMSKPLVRSARLGAPVVAFFGGTHAVTGATGVVPAGGSTNPAAAMVGEPFIWVFQVSGETAESYTVRGLPPGLVKSTQILGKGVSSFSGVPGEAGQFTVEIIGWRNPGERGDKTPTYELILHVEAGEPPVITAPPSGLTLQEGEDGQLAVTADGGGLHYRWFRDEQEIPSTVRRWIGEETELRVFVPAAPVDATWRSAIDFDDEGWLAGSGGVGYERSSSNTYDPYFRIDLEAALYNKQTAALIRIPFTLTEDDLHRVNQLFLRIQYDDGFAAFLNGEKVVDAYAPASLSWDSRATGGRDDTLAIVPEEIDLREHLDQLRVGANLLAIQVLNDGSNSSDLICNLELWGGRETDLPTLDLLSASPSDAGAYTVAVFNGAGEVLSERAIVEIAGHDSTLGSWQREHWMEKPLPAEAAPDADADGDGYNNLLEYALGTNPRRHDVQDAYSASVVGSLGQQRLVLRLAHAAVPDVTPVFEMSERLMPGAWQILEDGVDGVEIQLGDEEWVVSVPLSKAAAFVRMRPIKLE